MNKVIIIGNMTRDPEIRYSQSADPVAIARYTLAANRRFKKEGEPDADFINCVSFGRQAEFVEKYFKKGMRAAIVGRLSVRSYDDASGQRRWITEVIAEEVEFAESRSSSEARMAQSGTQLNAHYDAMAERYTPPSDPAAFAGGASAPAYGAAPASTYGGAPAPAAAPEGFAAITESIDDDDLPF